MSKRFFNIFSFYLTVCIFTITARVLIVPDQIFEDCEPEDQRAGVSDFSDFQLIPENDTHTFINGKWKFNKPVTPPWQGALITERYERGQWQVQAFNRNYTDICPTLHSPSEPTYEIFKHVPGCPMDAGSVWKFDMVPIQFSHTLLDKIPSYYMGRWRATFYSEFVGDDGKTLFECRRVYADMHED